MKTYSSLKAFTLVELLATIAIMAVLVVAALPYVADYTSWARATSQNRDAQVVAGAIARWIAVGGATTTSGLASDTALVGKAWTGAVFDKAAWTSGSSGAKIITCLSTGWTVVPGGARDPFLSPNTSFTAMGARIKILFTSSRSYTVTGRSH